MEIGNFFNDLINIHKALRLNDFIDVAVMAFLIYHGVLLMRETRAMQLVKGIVGIFILYFISEQFNLITLSFLMQNILSFGVLVLAVLFQPELRRALEQMGRSQFGIFRSSGPGLEEEGLAELIEVIGDSCGSMSSHHTGALIVIERSTRLGEIIGTGTLVDARPSQELVENLFFTNSPLHDGAMVIRQGRIHAAGCYLPLSSNMEIGRELGTRHRAALGMSEQSDAIVIIVSEETGAITVAMDSRLQRGLSVHNLKRLLQAKLAGSSNEEQSGGKQGGLDLKGKLSFWKGKK